MSSFKEIVINSVKPFVNIIFVVLLITLFIGFGYWVYQKYSPAIFQENKFNDVANKPEGINKDAVITLYYATWCPACKKAKPQWDSFKEEYDGNKQVNGYFVVCKEVDCSNNEDPEIAQVIQSHNIKGFPTIQMEVDNNVINFDSPVTKSTLELFVNKMLE